MRYRTYKRVDAHYRRANKKAKIEQSYHILYVNKDLNDQPLNTPRKQRIPKIILNIRFNLLQRKVD